MIRVGITGTDTGVGKTVVSRALAATAAARGYRVTAMKPVETGVAFSDPHRDGALLAAAARETRPLNITAPLVFPDPLAPLLSARRVNARIDPLALDEMIASAASDADVLLIEGAGGILVPVTETETFATLFRRWALDVVIVAANRLGVINHTRLTIAAAHAAGLRVRAVVLNRASPGTVDSSVDGNAALLRELETVPVVELPWMEPVRDLHEASDHLFAHVFPELEHAR